jgi:hypothetical protein
MALRIEHSIAVARDRTWKMKAAASAIIATAFLTSACAREPERPADEQLTDKALQQVVKTAVG